MIIFSIRHYFERNNYNATVEGTISPRDMEAHIIVTMEILGFSCRDDFSVLKVISDHADNLLLSLKDGKMELDNMYCYFV